MKIQALGLIEVEGFLGAIAATDAALKTAEVELINAETIRGGLTTIHLSGDVAAVKVAVESGAAAARNLNCLLSSHVIPRLSVEAAQMVSKSGHQQKEEVILEPEELMTEPDNQEKQHSVVETAVSEEISSDVSSKEVKKQSKKKETSKKKK